MQKPKKIIDIFPPKPQIANFAPKEEKPEPFLFPEKEIPPVFPEEKREKSRGKRVIALIFVFLILGFVFLHFVLAKAEIEIWPETKTLNFDEKVIIDTKAGKADFLTKVIPGKIFEEEKSASQQFSSSAKILKEEYSRGTIRVYNNYDFPQPLVINTRFQPPLEKVLYFRTTKSITVPAKSYLDLEVKADRAGEEYNIGPSTFSVPGLAGLPQYYSVYGKSFSPMSGGFKGEVSQVSQEDLEKAEKTLLERLEKEGEDYLRSKVSEDLILLEEATYQEIIDSSSSVPAGKEAETFNFTLKVRLKSVFFKRFDLDNFAKEIINLKIQDSEKKIQTESLKVDYYPESMNKELGRIVLNLKISAKVYSDVDRAFLKKNLLGKSLRETQDFLGGQPKIVNSKVKLWPFWIKKIPEEAGKVRIKLNID